MNKQNRYMELTGGMLTEVIVKRPQTPLTIYLAHPGTSEVKTEAKLLQKQLEDRGYKVLNPFDMDEHSRYLTRFWDTHPEVRKDKKLAEEIVSKDLKAIDKSDVLVAYVPSPGIGTSMEIFYAKHIRKIPVYILTDIVSPWLMNHGKVVSSVLKLLEVLKRDL